MAGLLVAFATLRTPVEAATCRQGPKAASEHCALPDGLGNFQGVSRCPSQLKDRVLTLTLYTSSWNALPSLERLELLIEGCRSCQKGADLRVFDGNGFIYEYILALRHAKMPVRGPEDPPN